MRNVRFADRENNLDFYEMQARVWNAVYQRKKRYG